MMDRPFTTRRFRKCLRQHSFNAGVLPRSPPCLPAELTIIILAGHLAINWRPFYRYSHRRKGRKLSRENEIGVGSKSALRSAEKLHDVWNLIGRACDEAVKVYKKHCQGRNNFNF